VKVVQGHFQSQLTNRKAQEFAEMNKSKWENFDLDIFGEGTLKMAR
jgi:hypothetical protein